MSQTIPRNPVIPNGPGDLRGRFPSQPNPYNIPAYPAPPSRPYVPSTGGPPPSLNPFQNRNGVALPGVPKTPGGNYVGPPPRQPYTYPGTRPHPGNWQPSPKAWAPREPLWRPGQPVQGVPRGFNWSINTQSRPNLPALPRSPGLNPRWPRWARIPPRMRIPAIAGLGHIGLGLLRPSPADWLFGIIPDAMEAARPWVWEQLGIRVPGETVDPNGPIPGTVSGRSYRVLVAGVHGPGSPHFGQGAGFNGVLPGPIYRVDQQLNGGLISYGIRHGNPETFTPYGSLPSSYPYSHSLYSITDVTDTTPVSVPLPGSTPSPAIEQVAVNPTNGIQPGTPPYSGMPATQRGTRPATDPRGWRPDLAQVPQTSPQPRAQTQAEPATDQAATNCRYTPASQGERDALNDKIRDLNEEIRRILRENEDLRAQLATANQSTFFQVPYVVENANGQRVKQFYPITLKGLVDTTSEASLSNQTADWALAKADRSERIYQILGGDSTWGSQPTPQAQVNPDAQLRAQPVIDEAGLGRMLDIRNLPQLFTATQAATYQRQGLQQFPITAQVPALTNNGLLPDREVAQTFNTATDVQMTTSNRGWAIVKGVNEVIIKTKQTIEWLKIDRLLNLLNFATTLHNALMLSNALGQTLMGIIDNILATFGFALKDATGNTIGVGDLIGGTIENVIKAAIGADNYTKLKKEWAKANRIYQAGMNIIYSVQSIGYSILGALEIVGKWIAWIGNALKRFGALTEKAYPWMNPTPNFQNPIFTKIEAAQEFAEALEVVTAESRSVTETVTELGNQKKALDKELEEGKDTRILPDNKEQKENQDKARNVSQAPIIPKFDLVRPELEDR